MRECCFSKERTQSKRFEPRPVQCTWPSSPRVLCSSVLRASDQCMEGHRFNFLFPCSLQVYYIISHIPFVSKPHHCTLVCGHHEGNWHMKEMTVPHQNHCLRDLSKNSMRVCEVHLICYLLSNIRHFSPYYTWHFARSLTCFHLKSDPQKVTKDIISSKPSFVLKEYKEYSRE